MYWSHLGISTLREGQHPYRLNLGKKLTEGMVELVRRSPRESRDVSTKVAPSRDRKAAAKRDRVWEHALGWVQ